MLGMVCRLCWILGGVLLLGVGGVLLFLQFYFRYTPVMCQSKKKMDGKTVIVTGSNSGIGRETALDLARRGARVIMACRNLDAANKVRDEIVKETQNDHVIVVKLDLSSLQSVRDFAAHINQTEPKLDVLIHNAGIHNTFSSNVTSDGLELTMATNQYGPFLLTHLLIDLLKKTGSSRIIFVSSGMYRHAKMDLKNPNPINMSSAQQYSISKYANIMFMLELARRLDGTGVTANCLGTGFVDTGIYRNVPFPLDIPVKYISKKYFRTPEEGAQTIIYLAVSEEVEGVSGKYFKDCKVQELVGRVSNMEDAKKYWDICKGLVQLSSTDPVI